MELEYLCGRCLLLLATFALINTEPVDYCKWDSFDADCGRDKVIVVQSAVYGRIDDGRCIERNYGYVGCSLDVTLMSDVRCSGLRACNIKIPDEKFDRTSPCPEDLSRYLRIDYRCQTVFTPARSCIKGTSTILSEPSGILASVTTDETGCGSTNSPWIIRGRPGQKIVLKMKDFATTPALINETDPGEPILRPGDHNCHVYATVREPAVKITNVPQQTICGGKSRDGNVKTYESNEIEVRVLTGLENRKRRHFLLEYKIVGCPDLQAPSGGWLERHDDVISAGCTEGKIAWRLECADDRWKGTLGNCTVANTKQLRAGYSSFTQTISIVVILAVALGIGAMILCIGLVCIRRRRRMAEIPDENYVTTGPRSPGNKDAHYRAANLTYNGYTPTTSSPRNEGSDENDYEYVDDIKPPVAPSGEPRVMTRPVAKDAKCSMHRGANQYTKYGTNVQGDVAKPTQVVVPRNNSYVGNMGHPIAPQYFELDPDDQMVAKGNVYHGNVGVTAHGGSQTDDMEYDKKQNFSFGHYSQ